MFLACLLAATPGLCRSQAALAFGDPGAESASRQSAGDYPVPPATDTEAAVPQTRSAAPNIISKDDLERDFQAAVAQYDSGHYAEAAAQLERLLPSAPNSFEVHELLGLVYSAQSQ